MTDELTRPTPEKQVLLDVAGLTVQFPSRDGPIRAVDGVSYSVAAGETLAIVGESGSGKSVSARAVIGLLSHTPAVVAADAILFDGVDLSGLDAEARRLLRGRRISMVFQDVLSSLHPLYPVGWQISEIFRIHEPDLPEAEVRRRAIELMDRVRIPSARERANHYPHQFSGGMRQRVMIALAIALGPSLLIADEPTTALDVTVQAQIMDLLQQLKVELGMALILITHDLGVVRDVADRVAIMYAGRFVETGPALQVFQRPDHPYTIGLLASRPSGSARSRALDPIPGAPPVPTALPPGCTFEPRCRFARPECLAGRPPLEFVSPSRKAACFFVTEVADATSG